MSIVFIGLGSSLGNRNRNLMHAISRLNSIGLNLHVICVSSIYESPHLGHQPEDTSRYPPHLNCVAKIETSLSPQQLLIELQRIEDEGGRLRTEAWGPRTIDMDILMYDYLQVDTAELTLPHPEMMKRAFVLVPLAEIAPELLMSNGQLAGTVALSQPIASQDLQRLMPFEFMDEDRSSR